MISVDGVITFPHILDKKGSWNQSTLLPKQEIPPRLFFPPVDHPRVTGLIVHDREYFVPLFVASAAYKEHSGLLRDDLSMHLKLQFLKDRRRLLIETCNVMCIDSLLTLQEDLDFYEKQICPIQQILMKLQVNRFERWMS